MEYRGMTMRILHVDDSLTMREMIEATLGAAGYDVVQAENGEEGLRFLKANLVDLIITDLNMPVMGGFVFIEKLREDAANLATPILIMTTEISKEVKQLGRSVGATGWITKPFNPEKLLAAIRRIVQ
jgi:two-component system chemotaxis response regulator CheY